MTLTAWLSSSATERRLRGEEDQGEEDKEDFSDDDDEEYEEFEQLVSAICPSHTLCMFSLIEILESQEVDEDDQALLDAYVPQGQLQPGRTLADLIMEKIGQAEDGGKGKEPGEFSMKLNFVQKHGLIFDFPFLIPAEVRSEPPPGFNPKVVEVYTK